jgi:hypothetical protein
MSNGAGYDPPGLFGRLGYLKINEVCQSADNNYEDSNDHYHHAQLICFWVLDLGNRTPSGSKLIE